MKVIITRHPSLLQYLIEIGLAEKNDRVLSHATAEDVEANDVIGVLPMALACLARTVTTVPLKIPQKLRGEELTIEQIRQFAQEPITYEVNQKEESNED